MGQDGLCQTQTCLPSPSWLVPGGLALESASLDPMRYVSGMVNKTQVAGGETEPGHSCGDL